MLPSASLFLSTVRVEISCRNRRALPRGPGEAKGNKRHKQENNKRIFWNLLNAKETNNKCIALAWSPQNRAFSNQKHWECSQAAFYKKLLWALKLTSILIFLGPCVWADLFTLNSAVDQSSKSRRQNHAPLNKEKLHSQFVQCNRGSGIQCRSIHLILSTNSVLKHLQLNYFQLLFLKRGEEYDFLVSRIHLCSKQKLQ